MALPSARDPAATAKALASWLEGRLGAAGDIEVGNLGGPPANGFSNETILFDASWTEGASRRERSLGARVKPTAHEVFPTDTFALQHRVMNVLGRMPGLHVPRVHWFEEDPAVLGAPFMVMDRVHGVAAGDNPPYTAEGWLLEGGESVQRAVWDNGVDAMARIHCVDWRTLGLSDLDPAPGSGPGGAPRLAQRLAAWESMLAWASPHATQPVPEAAVAWLWDQMPSDEGEPALCWGDSRIGNQLFTPAGDVVAVLDWEMVHVGDPVQDLAWYLWLDRHFAEGIGMARPPGFRPYESTVARWERTTGRTARDLAWHQVLAGLGFAVVMVRLARLLVDTELFPGDSDFERTNTGVTFLASELDRLGARSG